MSTRSKVDQAKPFGFRMVAERAEGGGFIRTAVFQCVACPATVAIKLAGGATLNPEFMAKKATQKGWQAYPYETSRNYCPRCLGPKRINDVNSELRKVSPMAVTPVPSAPVTPIKPVIEVRQPTNLQRVQIRGHLDKSFDDQAGLYLDEMSDARIAELVGVPRIIVEQMRETAYGPIKARPELVVLRQDIASLKAAIEVQQKSVDSLKTQVASLSSRLEQLLASDAA